MDDIIKDLQSEINEALDRASRSITDELETLLDAARREGYADGYDLGLDAGYDRGYEAGLADA